MDKWGRANSTHHDAVAPVYDQTIRPNWMPDAVFRFRADVAKFVNGLPRGARILDVGTGTGDYCAELVREGFTNIDAIDVSPAMVEATRAAVPIARAIEGDATALPYPDEIFDFISVKGCLHHIADTQGAIREMARCLKAGGLLRLQEPNADCFLTADAAPAGDIERPLLPAVIRKQLGAARLTILLFKTYLHFETARFLRDQGTGGEESSRLMDLLNPMFDAHGHGEIFLFMGRKD